MNEPCNTAGMPEFEVSDLLDTDVVSLKNVRCHGHCRHRSAEECTSATHLVFPYRGVYVRHVGSGQAVADANHVLFFNAGEGYQVSHPVGGGDSSLSMALPETVLQELAPPSLLKKAVCQGFAASTSASTRARRRWWRSSGTIWKTPASNRWKRKACC